VFAVLVKLTAGVPLNWTAGRLATFTVGVPIFAFTVPVTGNGVLVTATGMLATVVATIGAVGVLAPRLALVINAATVESTSRPRDRERYFLRRFIFLLDLSSNLVKPRSLPVRLKADDRLEESVPRKALRAAFRVVTDSIHPLIVKARN
jgi:hypothetical protein